MTRDQTLGLVLIIAGIIVPAAAIAVAQARDTIRHAAARCALDADRTPSPAEVANRLDGDAEESWDRLTCPECGRVDCTHGATAHTTCPYCGGGVDQLGLDRYPRATGEVTK